MQSLVHPTVSRSDVADHIDHYFDIEGDKREEIIDRMLRSIEALRATPETSVGYEDDRVNYNDVRGELNQFATAIWFVWNSLETFSPEAREALEKYGFDKQEQRWFATELDQLFWPAESAAASLPGTRGGRPVKRRKFVCALNCIMFFYELRPENAKPNDELLIEFAEETLRLADGSRGEVMRNAINKAFEKKGY